MTWIERDGALVRTFRTPDFLTSYNLISAMVGPAESMNHHPDITFGWGHVQVCLTTHDAGGITQQDHELAKLIDEAVKPFGL